MVTERRSGARHTQELEVELHARTDRVRLRALDVSRHGLFIASEEPSPLSHAVLLTVLLGGGPFETMATVARRVVDDKQGVPGMGVKLFCLGVEAKGRWDRFVASLEAPGVVLPSRRTPSRGAACFLVQPDEPAALFDFFSQNVVGGRTFYMSPALRRVGADVQVVLVHPHTREELDLAARVVEWNPDHPMRMGIRFEKVDATLRRRFRGFLGPVPGAGTSSMPDAAPLLPAERPHWTEYAFYSPKLRARAGETARELDVIEGKLLDLPELEMIDKRALFDFTWTNDGDEDTEP